jgi:hypothetical protein
MSMDSLRRAMAAATLTVLVSFVATPAGARELRSQAGTQPAPAGAVFTAALSWIDGVWTNLAAALTGDNGAGIDPNGISTTGDNGAGIDPNGIGTGDNGAGIDPNG